MHITNATTSFHDVIMIFFYFFYFLNRLVQKIKPPIRNFELRHLIWKSGLTNISLMEHVRNIKKNLFAFNLKHKQKKKKKNSS